SAASLVSCNVSRSLRTWRGYSHLRSFSGGEGRDWLRAMAPDLVCNLVEINERIRAEPNNLDLRRHRRELTKVVNWLREDNMKKIVRVTVRLALDNPKTTEAKLVPRCLCRKADTEDVARQIPRYGQGFSGDRPNQPLTIAILPWRPRRGWPIPDTHPTKTTDEDLAINAVPIADEIAWPHCASYSKPLTARASTRVRT